MASLETLVQEWLRLDRDQATRKEIQDLWDAGDIDELEKRMRPRIEFGTAGLRGKMEAGWSRMNDLTVLQTTQGLCTYVQAHVTDARDRGVVIGYDHRHNSERWAHLAARIFLSRGVRTYLLQGLVHTPMVPFSVKKLSAACGIMITASHNPKQDNGYKVYWENAIQIIGPHDEGISDAINANFEPTPLNEGDIFTWPLLEDRTQEMIQAYFTSIAAHNTYRAITDTCHIKFVNTSMHGVSDRFMSEAFSVFHLPPYIKVATQQKPDPDFPTVSFPNPEERGALDHAIQVANAEGATYVLAQDPDADRFAAAEKNADGTWSIFTGDQLGALFAAHILDQYKSMGQSLSNVAMISSIVSSRMLKAMAIIEGFEFRDCLTGFKHIGNMAENLSAQGFEVPFAYEEAIGYMFGSDIRDKDGVVASVIFAQLIAVLDIQGKTPRSFLEELYERYDFFKTSNSYFVCDDPGTVDMFFKTLGNYKQDLLLPSPNGIAGFKVSRFLDFTAGYDSGNPPSYKSSLSCSSGHMIQLQAGSNEGIRIILTIRGTEPKIKYYLEGQGKDRKVVGEKLIGVNLELEKIWLECLKHSP